MTYDVYFGTSTPPNTLIAQNQSGTTINRGGFSHSTTYYWRVVAKDNRGASTNGPNWRFTTAAPPPNPPRNLRLRQRERADSTYWDQITIEWDAPQIPPEVTYYTLYRNGSVIRDRLVSPLWYRDTGLNQATLYTYYVTANSDGGESDRSNQISVRTHSLAGYNVEINQTYAENLSFPGISRWINFSIVWPGEYIIEAWITAPVSTPRLNDSYLYLFRGTRDNLYVFNDDMGGGNLGSRISQYLESGTYYARIRAFNYESTGNFWFGVYKRSGVADLTPLADTYISLETPNDNYGNLPRLYVASLGDIEALGLVKFDVRNGYIPGVPWRAQITGATLRLYVDTNLQNNARTEARITRNPAWQENTVTWNNFRGYQHSNSENATVYNDVRVYDVFDHVNYWYSGNANYGFTIVDEYLLGTRRVFFYSREWGDQRYRPRLSISYERPDFYQVGSNVDNPPIPAKK